MTALKHPDPLVIQRCVTGQPDREVEAHLASCGACGTLALSLGGAGGEPDVAPVDPSLYVDRRPLRAGGMGQTSIARDVRVGRDVVIKEPTEPSEAAYAGAALRMERRLIRERRILGMLEHPAIVPLYEGGRWPDGTPFFAMRHIKGPTLAERIAETYSFAQRIVMLPSFISLAEAIGHAHGRGVVHRDLTPDNMMFGELDEPVVIDWGIATLLDAADDTVLDAVEPASDGMTRGGVGKDPYAPLEQRRGDAANPTFDVYSLGVTLHHLLGGSPPRRFGDGTFEPLPRECPEELVSIVARATASDPEERFADAGELAAELRRYQQGRLVEAHRYTLRARLGRWFGRHRAAVAMLLGCAIAATGLWMARGFQIESMTARELADLANAHRRVAQGRAERANQNRDEALSKWRTAKQTTRSLTEELQVLEGLTAQQVARLTRALDEERQAAKTAMELRVQAETLSHEAQAAAERALEARTRALDRARSAEENAEVAEARASIAERSAAEGWAEADRALEQEAVAKTQVRVLIEDVQSMTLEIARVRDALEEAEGRLAEIEAKEAEAVEDEATQEDEAPAAPEPDSPPDTPEAPSDSPDETAR